MSDITYQKDQEVRYIGESRLFYLESGYGNVRVEQGAILTVSRVFKTMPELLVRAPFGRNETRVIRVTHAQIEPADPNAPRPRKMGQKPEGDEHLDANDPRIAWIWEDMGRFATQNNWCGEYDRIADTLGVPGRERNFKVTVEIGGLPATFTVKARSKVQAEALVNEKVGVRSRYFELTS